TRVVIDQRNDVLREPNQALRYVPAGFTGKAGPTQVWVLRNGQPVAVPVVIGLDDDSFTEIVSGDVKAEDQIIVGEQTSATKTTAPRLRL
ncbi:MAG: efflux RND transporter periplasmic adaptor subunit, partial [Xanthobacteraceae bacterium]